MGIFNTENPRNGVGKLGFSMSIFGGRGWGEKLVLGNGG